MQAVISHAPSVRVMMAGATSSGYLPAPSPRSRASILLGHHATFGSVTHCTDDRTAAASSPSSLRAETLRGRAVTPKTSDDGRRDAGHKRVADDSDVRGCTRHPRDLRSPRASRAPKPILFGSSPHGSCLDVEGPVDRGRRRGHRSRSLDRVAAMVPTATESVISQPQHDSALETPRHDLFPTDETLEAALSFQQPSTG